MSEMIMSSSDFVNRKKELVLRAEKINEARTKKLRILVGKLLQKSFNEKVEPKPTEELGILGGLALKSAIKKWKGTYRSGEFSESVKHAFLSNQSKTKHSRTLLYYAIDKIQRNEAKDLFQVMKIIRKCGPSEAIDHLLESKE